MNLAPVLLALLCAGAARASGQSCAIRIETQGQVARIEAVATDGDGWVGGNYAMQVSVRRGSNVSQTLLSGRIGAPKPGAGGETLLASSSVLAGPGTRITARLRLTAPNHAVPCETERVL